MRKQCSTCGEMKPISAYHRRNHYTRSGYRSACAECVAQYDKQRAPSAPTFIEGDDKARVRARTRAAVMSGLLVKEVCHDCGALDVEAHHPTYEGAFAHLNVVWLCRAHHARRHGVRSWTRQLSLQFCAED